MPATFISVLFKLLCTGMTNNLPQSESDQSTPMEQSANTAQPKAEKLPEILAFAVVLGVGLAILPVLERYLNSFLSQYIANELAVTVILLIIAFGPLLLFENRIEQVVKRLVRRFYTKYQER